MKVDYKLLILTIILLIFLLLLTINFETDRKETLTKQMSKAFIIGSSIIAIIMMYIGFFGYQGKLNPNNCLEKNFNVNPFMTYAIVAPIYLGVMSSIAIFIKNKFNISTRKSFLIIGVISALIVSIAITVCHVYPFSRKRLVEQYLRLQIYHFFIYSVIISNLYIYLD